MLRPLANRLLLRIPEAPEKAGRFWLPPSAQADFVVCQAEIVARGDGVTDWRLQPGARVVCKRFGRAVLNDAEFAVWEHEILCIIDVSAL